MSNAFLLAIDQGTTSTRAMVFNPSGKALATAQRELSQIFPKPGWVEHDPDVIWQDTKATCREAVEMSGVNVGAIAGIGITNQRETTVLWDRRSGEVLHNAIVWQDRRTSSYCAELKKLGREPDVTAKTGLLLDPYFSATKIAWLLDNIDGARARAEAGDLACGTIDTFLVWRMTEGHRHVTDATTASRTLLYDIHAQKWDDDLLEMFNVPGSLLPDVIDNTSEFGLTTADFLGRPVPIRGMAGDQQAAAIGQACLSPGMIKSTYGTGCFALLNTGETAVKSKNKLLTTTLYRLDGKAFYALEGSIFIAGAAIQWLRDGLGIISDAAETDALARSANPNSGVYLVPAFTGLGAPYWDSDARAAIYGLTRDSGRAEIVRAALESVALQTRDLFEAMATDVEATPTYLRVDRGLAGNEGAMQCLSDSLAVPGERPALTETTALGAAYLAGLHAGVYTDTAQIGENWHLEKRFNPTMTDLERSKKYEQWLDAVSRTRTTH